MCLRIGCGRTIQARCTIGNHTEEYQIRIKSKKYICLLITNAYKKIIIIFLTIREDWSNIKRSYDGSGCPKLIKDEWYNVEEKVY